jgi:outer membrane protein assembly factor BamB
MLGIPFGQIGKVVSDKKVVIKASGKTIINADIDTLKDAWQKPLKW